MKYLSKEWIEVRDRILSRDNYSCQECKDFNPQLGTVEIVNQLTTDVEFHEYQSNALQSTYRISSYQNGLTIELNFETDWLVLPILQIHHKRYISGKEIWNYSDTDLITLCKMCHTKLHLTQDIPVYDENNEFIENRRFTPEDFSSGRNHNYKNWIFIREDKKKGEYKVTGVKPTVTYVVFEGQDTDLIAEKAAKMVEDFFNTYLPDYKK